MKNLKLISIALLLTLTTISCEKKWTCDCDVKYQNESIGQDSYESDYKKKKEAKTWCEGMNKDNLSQGGHKYSNCTLGNGSRT